MRYSIVIPTYNHFEDCLKPCLESIIQHTDLQDVEILVVANGCTDGTRKYLEDRPDKVNFIWFDEAIGFTKATNEGLRHATGEYVVILNNDTQILGSNWLEMLEKPFKEDFSVGITGAAKNYHEPTEHDFLLFFCVMLSRNTIQKIGKLDEVFNPGYGEDIDYCFKVRRAGMRVVQVPNDVNLSSLRDIKDHTIQFPIWHKSSQTVHAVPKWTEIVERNEKILLNRYKKLDSYHAYSMFDQIPANRITETIDRITSQLKENGQVFFNLNERTTLTLGKGGFIHGIFPGKENMDKLKVKTYAPFDPTLEGIKSHVLMCGSKGIAQFGGEWEGGYATQQDPDEISQLLFDLKGHNIKDYLEIGCAEGGVTRLICDIAEVRNVTHIDLGWGDMNHPYTYRQGIENLRVRGKIDIFRGDSTSQQAIDFLGKRKFDVIFIDGDHSYEGVLKDTELAMEHATEGALVIYHDHEAVQDVGRIYTEIRDGQFPELSFEKEYISDNPVTRKGISVFRYNSVPIEGKPTKKEDPKISIVIPTYNHLEDCLKPCIDSIKKYTSPENIEIIVVANGCDYGTMTYIKEIQRYKEIGISSFDIKLIWHDDPLGFIKATNLGIKAAKGEFIVLLNNDTELLPQEKDEWLKMLAIPFTDEKVGITGPYKDWRFFWENDKPIFRTDYMVFYCAMIRKEVFDKVGLLDEAFGMGYEEDIDFAIRAKKAGYKIVQVPEDLRDELNITKEFLLHYESRNPDFPLFHKDSVTFNDLPVVRTNNSVLLSKWRDDKPKYSIIIPTFNHLEDLLKPCIRSIAANTNFDDVEVIIVANGCTDATRDWVNNLGSPFKLFWIDEQVGYIKATNAGIKQAMGDYIILLNNDVQIQGEDWINNLVREFVSNAIGIVGPVKAYRDDVKRDYILFWCAMIDRKVFDKIGLLDEQFGLGYHEDVDFCIRAEDAGFKLVGIEGDFPIYHKGGGTFAPICGNSPERLDEHKQKLYDKHGVTNRKVYDCFTFFNELDVLEIRLEELWDVVDHFVLVEARFTHQGKPKKLFFGETKEAKQRFLPYISKIRHIVVDEFPHWCTTTWDREHYQRDCISRGLKDAKDNDIIIISDADEILKADTVRNYKPEMGVAAVEMPLFYYKLDWKLDEKWYKPRIFRFADMKDNISPQSFRGGNDYDYKTIIPNGGWHFSFLGDKDSIKYKIQSYAHEEFNNESITNDSNIIEAIEKGKDVFGRNLHFNKVQIDYSTYPYWVVENLQYYIDKGLVSKPTLSKEFIDVCISNAEKNVSKIDKDVFSIMSMLNERTRHLMNNLGTFGGNYLEVGSWHGGSVCSLISNNKLKSVTIIDDFSQFQPTPEESWLGDKNPKDVLTENIKEHNSGNVIRLIEGDFYKTDLKDLPPIDIFFYDGGHDYESQKNALKYVLPILADTFLFIVDDYHWPEVNKGTKDGIYDMIDKIQLLHERELLSFTPPKEVWPNGWQEGLTNLIGEWRNGVYIGLFKKVSETPRPKVYDCFSFFNELDLLEIRLNELDPYVDYFVISEMGQTHSGNPKPFNYEQNRERFKKFWDKIIYMHPPDIETTDPWTREHYQRDYMKSYLHTVCKDNDYIIVSDLDEIPRGSKIQEYNGKGVFAFEQNQYSYYLNYNVGISPLYPGTFSRITNWGYIKRNNLSLTGLRYLVLTEDMVIKDGGWHFSWMGGSKKIVEKLESWAHQEFNKPELKDDIKIHRFINSGKEHLGREGVGETTHVEIDDTFPEYVQSHQLELYDKGLLPIYRNNKVAIVMPYYNDPFLTKSVAGILGQRFKNWKLFIIDDGSDKAASDILANHPQIYHIKQNNQGPSAARNEALRWIKQQDFTHIAFCDSDDIWNPDYLQSQLNAIGDSQIVYCSVNEQFENGETAYPWGIPDPPEYPGREVMLATPFIYISGVVCTKECLSLLEFDSRLDSIEDWDMWLRLDEAGFKFKKNNKKLLTYTVKQGMAGQRTEDKTKLLKEKHEQLTTTIN